MSLKGAIKHVIHRTISDRFAKLDLPSHSVEDNRHIWATWDWSQGGDEWTRRAENPEQWLKSFVDNILHKYMEQGKEILEIGPGAGRWTEYLQPIAKRLVLVDITPKCIALCKTRFAGRDSNIDYHIIDGNIDFIPDNSLDRVWSYDVFVHVNPSDTERYIKSISRILRPGGIAVIHHASWGEYKGKAYYRSRLTAAAVAQFVRDAGLTLVEQNRALAHKQGDVITVFQKEN